MSPIRLQGGALYIVATTLGNPGDISVRALQVLQSAALIAAETASVARDLLQHYGIDTPVMALRGRSVDAAIRTVLERLRTGDAVALVSDAGTPIVADPGASLVRVALDAGVSLCTVPGATAAVAALVLSGLPAGRFAFDGFPPRARTDRNVFFAALKNEERTLILYESPRWLRDTLARLANVLGGCRKVLVARNMTRSSEALFYGTLEQAQLQFAEPVRGEYTLVVSGATVSEKRKTAHTPSDHL